MIKWFSGTGDAGYSDGDSGSAMFKHPKSFALDFKGNVYVADKSNHAIRKISNSGIAIPFTGTRLSNPVVKTSNPVAYTIV